MKNKNLFWIFALSAITYFIQGSESLGGQALFIYFKNILNLSPSTIMYLGTLTGLAWLIKPAIGMLIDKTLTKKQWYFIALGLDILMALFIGLFSLPLGLLIGILFINSTCTSFRDITNDGIMVIEGKKYNATGRIQSIQWIALTIAGILIGISGGLIAQYLNYKIAFLIIIPLYLLAGLTMTRYKETRHSLKTIKNIDYKILFKNKKFLWICLFIFLYNYSPSFGVPLSFIMRDKFHWSEIWIGGLGTITSIISILGALIYYKISTKINIRKWIVGSVFLGACTTLSYLYYTPHSAIIYSIIYSFIGMAIFLMIMDFYAKNSLIGCEATSFATLCAINNIAGSASSLSGAWLFPRIGLQPLIILSALTSFVCLLFIKKVFKKED